MGQNLGGQLRIGPINETEMRSSEANNRAYEAMRSPGTDHQAVGNVKTDRPDPGTSGVDNQLSVNHDRLLFCLVA